MNRNLLLLIFQQYCEFLLLCPLISAKMKKLYLTVSNNRRQFKNNSRPLRNLSKYLRGKKQWPTVDGAHDPEVQVLSLKKCHEIFDDSWSRHHLHALAGTNNMLWNEYSAYLPSLPHGHSHKDTRKNNDILFQRRQYLNSCMTQLSSLHYSLSNYHLQPWNSHPDSSLIAVITMSHSCLETPIWSAVHCAW